MNYLTFDVNAEHQIDGNYISIYDKSQDTYQYCVQRLIGKPIENEKSPTKGKIWLVYINGSKTFWDSICTDDLKVCPSDKIIWNYQDSNEKVDLADHFIE